MKAIIFLSLIILTSCNNNDYLDGYREGYNEGSKLNKTYFEFKNVPAGKDTTIVYSTEDIHNMYYMYIKYDSCVSNIQLKLWRKD